MESDELCLQWNSHKQTLISLLDTLLEKERLVDVTLAADGQFIRAHRLVLCACSQYFEDLLGTALEKQAIIFLKDVSFPVVKALVEYMYKGEVNVARRELHLFLSSGKALQIKGLTESTAAVCSTPFESQIQSLPKVPSTAEENKKIPPLVPVNCFEFVPPILTELTVQFPNKLPLTTEEDSSKLQQLIDVVGEDNFMAVDEVEAFEALNSVLEADPFDDDVTTRPPSINEGLLNKTRSAQSKNDGGGEDYLSDADLKDSSRPCNKKIDSLSKPIEVSSNGRPSTVIKGRGDCTCPKCGRRYKQRHTLRRHCKFECGQEPKFKCLLCPMLFKRKDKLRDHESRRHPKDPLLLANQQPPDDGRDQRLNTHKESATRTRLEN